MPSLAQLQAEPWWNREIVTPELDWLGDELCRILGRPRSAFGTKGNEAHLNGGHRSQEWIKNSDWCTNTSYTVQSGLSETQARHIAAADYTPGAWGTTANRALVAAQTKSLWDAARRGELTGLRQIQGTLDGRKPIGLNVVSGSTMVPDSSHLEHWHLTFDRKRMRDMALMQRILNIVIGVVDVAPSDVQEIWQNHMARNGRNMADNLGEAWQAAQEARALAEQANVKLDALTVPVPAPVDPAVVAAAVQAALADPVVLGAIAKAVNDDAHQRLAG